MNHSKRSGLRSPRLLICLVVVMLGISGCGKETDSGGTSNQESGLPRDPAGMNPVTAVYGAVILKPGRTYAEAKSKPWSSYWFPKNDTSLFEPVSSGELSPLQKYDRWVKKTKSKETHAAEWEKKAYDADIGEDAWAGLCNAWSKAAILEPEPANAHPVEVDGIKFSSFDLKALLIKTYDNTDEFKVFGQRFDGKRGDDFNDIYPDQFHRFLQATLFEKHEPFIMDRDPGIQVWNVPIFAAQVDVTLEPSDSHLAHVHTTVAAAGTRDDLGFIGTWQINYEYFYDLYGSPQPDGSFVVESGMWTGASLDNHPDFVTLVPEKSKHFSDNPELKTEFVAEILEKARKVHSLMDWFSI